MLVEGVVHAAVVDDLPDLPGAEVRHELVRVVHASKRDAVDVPPPLHHA